MRCGFCLETTSFVIITKKQKKKSCESCILMKTQDCSIEKAKKT